MTDRKGVTAQYAQIEMRRRHTLIGAMMIHKGQADGMICGTFGTHDLHLHYVDQVLGRAKGSSVYGAMNILILQSRVLALVDTHVNENPSAEHLAEITLSAAHVMRSLGLEPRVALLSHSNFGSVNADSARKMRAVLSMVRAREPEMNIDGEMHADVAIDAELRRAMMPHSTLQGDANLLVLPSLESANIAYNLLKRAAGNNVAIGPILLGCRAPVHILTASATVRRVVNMTALTVKHANSASWAVSPV
jgi:malate dehydrogenase (oxaloacetate-decarboxylating)(NADP+)